MSPRLARLCLIILSSALICSAPAQQPPPGPLPQNPPQQPSATPPAPPEEEEVLLKLPDADIDTVLSALEIYTGRIILRPQQLTTATYNLKIPRPIPKSEAILAIETVLALNGIGISPLGDKFLKVVNLQNVRMEAPEMITDSAFSRPASGKIGTKLFQLEFMRVGEFVPMIQTGMLNPYFGTPVQFPNANAVFITDTISNLQRVELLLQQLDKPVTAGMKPKFYPLTHARASDLVTKLRTILQGTLQVQLGSATTYSADDRTNQVVLVTDPRQHAFFDELIERLDQSSDPNTRHDVIYLKHAKAADVVTVLGSIIRGQTQAIQQRQSAGSVRPGQVQPQPGQPPGTPPQPGQPPVVSASSAQNPNLDNLMGGISNEFSALMTVVNDDRSNAVVVTGTPSDIELVKTLIDKLDIVLAQVRIEVVIAEVTLDDQHNSGISSLGLLLDGDKLVGFAGSYQGVGNSQPFTISNGTLTRPGISGPWDLAAEISIGTTPRKRDTAIINVPAIVTSHGKKAMIFNGETRPVVTGQIQSGIGGSSGLASSSTVTQLPIGARLTVEPFIGIDGSVQLNITQSLEDVTGEVLIDQNVQYVIGKRETESYITAKSGEIIVLGGFRKNSTTKSTSRLGPIPILGDIFGGRTRGKSQTEVIFFLRPTVLTNTPAVDNVDAMKRVEEMRTREEIKKELDPNYRPPPQPKSVLDNILPK